MSNNHELTYPAGKLCPNTPEPAPLDVRPDDSVLGVVTQVAAITQALRNGFVLGERPGIPRLANYVPYKTPEGATVTRESSRAPADSSHTLQIGVVATERVYDLIRLGGLHKIGSSYDWALLSAIHYKSLAHGPRANGEPSYTLLSGAVQFGNSNDTNKVLAGEINFGWTQPTTGIILDTFGRSKPGFPFRPTQERFLTQAADTVTAHHASAYDIEEQLGFGVFDSLEQTLRAIAQVGFHAELKADPAEIAKTCKKHHVRKDPHLNSKPHKGVVRRVREYFYADKITDQKWLDRLAKPVEDYLAATAENKK